MKEIRDKLTKVILKKIHWENYILSYFQEAKWTIDEYWLHNDITINHKPSRITIWRVLQVLEKVKTIYDISYWYSNWFIVTIQWQKDIIEHNCNWQLLKKNWQDTTIYDQSDKCIEILYNLIK